MAHTTGDETTTESIFETASRFFVKTGKLLEWSKRASIGFGYVAAGLSAVGVATEIADQIRKHREDTKFSIKITDTDPLYSIVEGWINETLSSDNKRNVLAHTKDVNRSSSGGSHRVDRRLVTTFDGTISQHTTVKGHAVKVYIADGSSPGGGGAMPDTGLSMRLKERTINLEFATQDMRDSFLKVLDDTLREMREVKPGMYMSSFWGGFRRVDTRAPRPIESVVLKSGQMERLVEHVKTFFDNEEAYARIGSPYHTGLVLHGLPGTGKTSTAATIANHLGLSIYVISLSNIEDDDALSRCVTEVPPYSILLFEDIDVYKSVRTRTDDDEGSSGRGVTMQGILNALDGLSTPHGVVKIITTNHLHKLDPAIVRAGRIDLTEHLDALDNDQLRRLCEYLIGFVPDDLPEIDEADGITAAEISSICRKYVPNFYEAAGDIREFVASKATSLQAA